ncbi:MAG TPA: TspO/MBR family protein [Candidatus Paceibacterota bacterium]|jgi:tryptophan-rich sensory protein|nr:TspO/MBR family protein [Candidatus Paceibacterota bacterium]
MKNTLRVVVSFALVFGAVVLASFFITPQASSWYAALVKPDFTPPNLVFAFVWVILYVLMAFALASAWMHKVDTTFRRWSFTFTLQLGLNILWAVLFFGLHGLFLPAIDSIALWFAVIVLTVDSWDIDRLSFWLLIPYLAWMTFAMILSIAIWWVN